MIPIPHLGQASAHPNEAMNSIQSLQRTGHATTVLAWRHAFPA